MRKKDLGQAGNGGHFAAKTNAAGTTELAAPSPSSHDMTWWDEEDRAFPASLYEAGLDGELEPYNGDYPVNDGALRYWREDMARELVIGELEDGTTVVAVDPGDEDYVFISENVGTDPTPEQINAAVGVVREKAADLPEPE